MNWKEYERRKKAKPDNISSEEYEKFIKKIVKDLENGTKNKKF